MEPSSDISIEGIDENIKKSSLNRVRKRKKQLYADLKKQMEFYLSDANLRKDRYFGHLMQTSQCISVETFLNCNKIKSLTTNPEDIVKAIESSTFLAVSDCKTKIHRIKPIEEKQPEDIERCTIYVEQLPPKADHDWVKSMFEKYGNIAYISLPKFKSGTIKRFAFVEFENEECASKALEEHRKEHEVPKILPEELQSIITFEQDGKNEVEDNKNSTHSPDNVSPVKKRKLSVSSDGIQEKKLKRETSKVSYVSMKNIKKKKKKDKHKKSDVDSDNKNTSVELSESDHSQIATLNENLDSSIEKSDEILPSDDDKKDSNVELNVDRSVQKKKRKRNKGKKVKSDSDKTTPELRVMSKTDWRKLRNKYLNLQRQKMSLLKAHLRHPRFIKNRGSSTYEIPDKVDQNTNIENVKLENTKYEDIRVKYEPGVILKVSFVNPIESDKIFKAEAKMYSNVKFVDVINNFEAYVRCDCRETANKIAEENRWPQTTQLQGEEEKLYWEKILRDREIKCTKQKGTKKQRGRSKLINKAEKILAQHVKFSGDDE